MQVMMSVCTPQFPGEPAGSAQCYQNSMSTGTNGETPEASVEKKTNQNNKTHKIIF